MDIKSFIESGLLESYILGQGAPEERHLVEEMLQKHPEAAKEKAAIEETLEKYAYTQSAIPPAWMKGRIMEQIEMQERLHGKDLLNGAPPRGFNNLLLGAGIISFGLLSLLLWQLNQGSQNKAEISTLQQQVAQCETRSQAQELLKQQIAFLQHPKTQKVEIKADDGSQYVSVFNNSEQRQTLLGTVQMPALAADKDYQLWVIAGNNPNPIPLNIFQQSAENQAVTFHAEAKAFAISEEPKGGSPNGVPTKVLLIGTI